MCAVRDKIRWCGNWGLSIVCTTIYFPTLTNGRLETLVECFYVWLKDYAYSCQVLI